MEIQDPNANPQHCLSTSLHKLAFLTPNPVSFSDPRAANNYEINDSVLVRRDVDSVSDEGKVTADVQSGISQIQCLIVTLETLGKSPIPDPGCIP